MSTGKGRWADHRIAAAITCTVTTSTSITTATSSASVGDAGAQRGHARWSPATATSTNSASTRARADEHLARAGRAGSRATAAPRPSRHQALTPKSSAPPEATRPGRIVMLVQDMVADDRDEPRADGEHGDAAAHRHRAPDRRPVDGGPGCPRRCAASGGRRTARSRPAPRRAAAAWRPGGPAPRRRTSATRTTTTSKADARPASRRRSRASSERPATRSGGGRGSRSAGR